MILILESKVLFPHGILIHTWIQIGCIYTHEGTLDFKSRHSDHLSRVDCDPDSNNLDLGPGACVNLPTLYCGV